MKSHSNGPLRAHLGLKPQAKRSSPSKRTKDAVLWAFNPFTLWEVCAHNGFSPLSIEIHFGAGRSAIRPPGCYFSATPLSETAQRNRSAEQFQI
jgi:hypothetical protein